MSIRITLPNQPLIAPSSAPSASRSACKCSRLSIRSLPAAAPSSGGRSLIRQNCDLPISRSAPLLTTSQLFRNTASWLLNLLKRPVARAYAGFFPALGRVLARYHVLRKRMHEAFRALKVDNLYLICP